MRKLYGLGSSETSFEALERTVDRALEAGDELEVAVLAGSADAVEQESRARALVEERGLDSAVVWLDDAPALVEHAERGGFDAVVVSCGPRGPLGKTRLDEVAQFVVMNSRVGVEIVR